METDVASDAALDDLAEGAHQLARLVQGDEAGQRLLEHFVLVEPQEVGDGLLGKEDFAVEVGDEHRVRRVGDDEVGVETIHREDFFRRCISGRPDSASTARPTRRPSTSSAIPKRLERASSLIVPVPTLPTRRQRQARRLAVAIHAIVLASFLRIPQDRVRLLNVRESACGTLIPGDVGMVFERSRRALHRPGSRREPCPRRRLRRRRPVAPRTWGEREEQVAPCQSSG